jgi:hypothetical protein
MFQEYNTEISYSTPNHNYEISKGDNHNPSASVKLVYAVELPALSLHIKSSRSWCETYISPVVRCDLISRIDARLHLAKDRLEYQP